MNIVKRSNGHRHSSAARTLHNNTRSGPVYLPTAVFG
jgi:hypothetical protein